MGLQGKRNQSSEEIPTTCAYQVKGEGSETIVLLRGLGRWSDHWLGFEDRLIGKGFRLVLIDNRGFGHSNRLPLRFGATVPEFAEDVGYVIANVAPMGAHVIGVSLGGMIGLSLAAQKPHLVRSLIVANTSVACSNLNRLSWRAKSVLLSLVLGLKSAYSALSDLLLGEAAPEAQRKQFAESWRAIDGGSKFELTKLLRQLLAARSFHGAIELASIRCPVTIIKSEGDLLLDPANSEFIHSNLKGSTIARHPSAGHELAVADPAWLEAEIFKHVSSVT